MLHIERCGRIFPILVKVDNRTEVLSLHSIDFRFSFCALYSTHAHIFPLAEHFENCRHSYNFLLLFLMRLMMVSFSVLRNLFKICFTWFHVFVSFFPLELVKRSVDFKSRGVKLFPGKDNSNKFSICESTLCYYFMVNLCYSFRVDCSKRWPWDHCSIISCWWVFIYKIMNEVSAKRKVSRLFNLTPHWDLFPRKLEWQFTVKLRFVHHNERVTLWLLGSAFCFWVINFRIFETTNYFLLLLQSEPLA